MTNKEMTDVINALVRWFDSQGIMPNEAGPIMIRLIALEYYLKSGHDVIALQRSINLTKDLLTCEISDLLRA